MKHSSFRLVLLIALTGLLAAVVARADAVLVGNPALTGQVLDADGVKAVLLGKKSMLGSTRAVIIIAKAGAAQETFLKDRVGMTTSQLQTHWRRLFMTGGGTAPKIVETEEEAGNLAAATPGGIAIVDAAKAGSLVVLSAK
jgi:hypothetical protein